MKVLKVRLKKIYEDEAYMYAVLKMSIWKTCYNDILPKTYINNISVHEKALKYQQEMKNDSFISYYFIVLSDTPIGVLRLKYFHNSAKENCLCIKDLYLLPNYQNKGYGAIVFSYIKKQAREKNCIYITAWIIEKNQSAINLGRKAGFKRTSSTQIHKKSGAILNEYYYKL